MNCANLSLIAIVKGNKMLARYVLELRVSHCITVQVFNAWRRVTLTAADDYSMPVVVDEEDTTVLNLFFKQWKIKYMQKNCKMR